MVGGKLRKIHDPAAAVAVQVGGVDGERIDALRGENLFGLCAGGKRGEIGRADSFRRVGGT